MTVPDGFTIERSGASAFVAEHGEGPAIVLLASTLVRARTYRATVEALQTRFQVFTVELPGCGRGSKVAVPWSLQTYAEWVGGLLDALPVARATLIGHSNSGAVALMAAALRPQRIERLILADTIGADERHSLARVLAARALDGAIELKLTLSAWHHAAFNLAVHTRNCLHQIKLAAAADLLDVATRVPVPTLLAWGARDHTMPLRCADALQARLPNAQRYVSRTGSHDWIVTRPLEFADAIMWFTTRSAEARP